jgi:acetylornithine deacetylase/succinyl-diaminopimelate desuccinylase-like protein
MLRVWFGLVWWCGVCMCGCARDGGGGWWWCWAQVVEFGVCNPTIHKVDECVALADLEALPGVYAQALRRILLPGSD